MKLSTMRQKMRETMMKRMRRRTKRAISRPRRLSLPGAGGAGTATCAGVRRLQTVEGAFGGLTFRTLRRELDHLLPRVRRALQILLAERFHDAEIQQRLRVLRID